MKARLLDALIFVLFALAITLPFFLNEIGLIVLAVLLWIVWLGVILRGRLRSRP